MSLRLQTTAGAPLVRAALALALAAVVLALLPSMARAQTHATTEDGSAPTVVVRPGDSLWSISEERLGPNASPRRVMNGAERIHALNRGRIGADPDLLLVGQVLSVPRAMAKPTDGATPAHQAAEASGSDPKDRAAGSEGRETPRRRGPREGAIPRSEISLQEAAEMLGARADDLPDPRAVAPVPAARPVAPNGARPDPLFRIPTEASAGDRRRLLGWGIIALTLLLAVLVPAHRLGVPRLFVLRREPRFREPYGSPHPVLDSLAGPEGGPKRKTEARELPAFHASPTYAAADPEDHIDLTDPFVLARAKRARVRRQSPEPRARGLRRPAQTRTQRKPLGGRMGGTVPIIRREWEPDAALVSALKGLPLLPGSVPGGDLARLRPLLEEALGALGRLERRRGLSEREKTRREALTALMRAIERAR